MQYLEAVEKIHKLEENKHFFISKLPQAKSKLKLKKFIT